MKEVNIEKLEFPYNVRKRQGMYGSSGENADILFREIVDNAVDLVMKNRISIDIESYTNMDGWNAVIDNGFGMPLYLDKDYPDKDRPITIDMLSKINIGSNFNQTEYSAGLNGTGSKLTNALSDYFYAIVNAGKKDKKTLPKFIQQGIDTDEPYFVIKFEKGILKYTRMVSFDDLKMIFNNDADSAGITPKILESIEKLGKNFGTAVVFKPDATLLDTVKVAYHAYPFKLIKSLFQYDKDFSDVQVSFKLNGKEVEPYSLESFLRDKDFIDNKIITRAVSVKTEENHPIKFIYQAAYSKEGFDSMTSGSVNLLETKQGVHINLVQQAIGEAFSQYNSLIKPADARLGLRLFVLNLAIKPLFNSQDKTKLSKYEDKGSTQVEILKALSKDFLKFMKENQPYFDLLCERIIEYKKATSKLSNIELLKSHIVMGDDSDSKRTKAGQMSKVFGCTTRDYDKAELYIVEGLSAGGNLIARRNTKYQAILPIRGKLKNTSGMEDTDLVSNAEVLAIINTIGVGAGAIVDVSKARYGKVIIATDADSDGCLTGDTLIRLASGESVKISSLANRDSFDVLSYSKDGKKTIGKGHSARITKMVNHVYTIVLDDKRVVTCTDNHPFLLSNGTFVRADELKEYDLLMPVADDKPISISRISVNYLPKPIEVWDITVEEHHNFALSSGVFVHNSHIQNLVAGLFYMHLPELIKAGKLYVLETPYYEWHHDKKVEFFYYDEKDKIDFNKGRVFKLKGLGSSDPDVAEKYMLDANHRRLVQIVYDPERELEIREASRLLYSSDARRELMYERGVFLAGNIK